MAENNYKFQAYDTTIGGRPVRVQSVGRIRSKVGRRFYNGVVVRFTDTNECMQMGAAEFDKWARRMDRAHDLARRFP